MHKIVDSLFFCICAINRGSYIFSINGLQINWPIIMFNFKALLARLGFDFPACTILGLISGPYWVIELQPPGRSIRRKHHVTIRRGDSPQVGKHTALCLYSKIFTVDKMSHTTLSGMLRNPFALLYFLFSRNTDSVNIKLYNKKNLIMKINTYCLIGKIISTFTLFFFRLF